YTKTCFEFVHDGLGAQSGIGGGGRYDGLMAQLGGQDLSGIGFGLGVDRTVLALEAEGVSPTTGRRVDVYGVPMGADAKRRMAVVVDRLRRAGVSADMSYGDRGLKGAMKGADRAGALFALVLGDNELRDGTVVLRDLSTRQQTEVAVEDVEQVVTRALAEVTA
ncbi:His/Gly/Thr/Pro-type tRNA ligase C-terminal domain-containing protein, partial [Corynebacterium sp.]|uniref:His/Gly/Thr/Pro-type tRNA ligase C-terminal domain-containing protein n=1 Tax=Corynebacterium sp. TaxID=1720 RepID=UPI00264930B4